MDGGVPKVKSRGRGGQSHHLDTKGGPRAALGQGKGRNKRNIATVCKRARWHTPARPFLRGRFGQAALENSGGWSEYGVGVQVGGLGGC